jgi:hypothetical protein
MPGIVLSPETSIPPEIVISPLAKRYTGVFKAFGTKYRRAPGATVIVVQ